MSPQSTMIMIALVPTLALPAADQPLLSWLAARGGSSSVAVATRNNLRGLECTRDAEVGEVLLEVPLSAVLTDAVEPQLPGVAPSWTAPLPSMVQLAIGALLRQQAPDFAPYLSSWPAGMPELPANLEPGDVEADAEFVAQVSASRLWFEEQHAAAAILYAKAHPGQLFPCDLDEFRTAVQLAGSRCLRVACSALGRELRLLVPVVDMANHDGNTPSAIYTCAASEGDAADAGELGCVQLRAARPLRRGDAVTISYGEHTNAHFAQFYGFVPQDNPHDAVTVSLLRLLQSLPDERVTRGSREAMAMAAAAAGFEVSELQLHANGPSESAMLALRAALSADGGWELAEMLEAVAMDEIDEDDLEEDDDDESAAERARLVAAVCVEMLSEAGSEADEASSDEAAAAAATGEGAGGGGVLDELRRSRVNLLATLRDNMMQASSGSGGGALAALACLAEQRRRETTAYPHLESGFLSRLGAGGGARAYR